MPFYRAVLASRDEWNDVDLVVAAQLARSQRDIEVESRKLQREGMVVVIRGKPRVSPRFKRVDRLIKLEMALMRTLGIGGRGAGDRRDEAGRRAAQREAEKVQAELATEELLAKL